MTRFIMIRRRTGTGAETTPTWVNVENINMISAAVIEPEGTRISMRDGFLIAEENVSTVLEKIRRAEDDR